MSEKSAPNYGPEIMNEIMARVDVAIKAAKPVFVDENGDDDQKILDLGLNWYMLQKENARNVTNPYIPDMYGKSIGNSNIGILTADDQVFWNVLWEMQHRIYKINKWNTDKLEQYMTEVYYNTTDLAQRLADAGADQVLFLCNPVIAVSRRTGDRYHAAATTAYWGGSIPIPKYVEARLTQRTPTDMELATIGFSMVEFESLRWNIDAAMDHILSDFEWYYNQR